MVGECLWLGRKRPAIRDGPVGRPWRFRRKPPLVACKAVSGNRSRPASTGYARNTQVAERVGEVVAPPNRVVMPRVKSYSLSNLDNAVMSICSPAGLVSTVAFGHLSQT
jgi:hypothetical protein